jgi:hypothetical protein
VKREPVPPLSTALDCVPVVLSMAAAEASRMVQLVRSHSSGAAGHFRQRMLLEVRYKEAEERAARAEEEVKRLRQCIKNDEHSRALSVPQATRALPSREPSKEREPPVPRPPVVRGGNQESKAGF